MIARLLALLALLLPAAAVAQDRAEIERTMRRATAFMTDHVAVHGGYVWSYLPDMSRRWGEIEARPNMVWVQPPGTATMGHVFLDAYHATGDPLFYRGKIIRAANAARQAVKRSSQSSRLSPSSSVASQIRNMPLRLSASCTFLINRAFAAACR